MENKKQMTEQETEQIEKKLDRMFKTKHPDIKSHVDLINGTDEIKISFFWNRISKEQWENAKSFRMKSQDYESKLKSEIIPFLTK